jgi:hypothetical protein
VGKEAPEVEAPEVGAAVDSGCSAEGFDNAKSPFLRDRDMHGFPVLFHLKFSLLLEVPAIVPHTLLLVNVRRRPFLWLLVYGAALMGLLLVWLMPPVKEPET